MNNGGGMRFFTKFVPVEEMRTWKENILTYLSFRLDLNRG